MTKPEINNINTWEVAIEEATPAMQKFLEIKKEYPKAKVEKLSSEEIKAAIK